MTAPVFSIKMIETPSIVDWQPLQSAGKSFSFPTAINCNCPYCRRLVTFALSEPDVDHGRNTVGASAKCPNCKKKVFVWAVQTGDGKYVAMFPAPADDKKPIEGYELIPESVRRAYVHAIQAYNAEVWPAAATQCGRTLEGTLVGLTEPPSNKPLYQLLQDLASSFDFSKPIKELADTVRKGRNIGAHFDMNFEPDEEMASTLLSLLEYLLEYFYILPKRIEGARQVIENKTPSAQAEP